jgi:tetratricopeptide (TPR) repeat protein
MPFLERAQTIYSRGETASTVIALVEGLKREPGNSEAFRWLVDLYCDEIEHPGLEEDIVSIFDASPDPSGVYAYVFKRLARAGQSRLLRQLDKARRDSASKRGMDLPPWTPETDELAFLHPQERPEHFDPVAAAPELVAATVMEGFSQVHSINSDGETGGASALSKFEVLNLAGGIPVTPLNPPLPRPGVSGPTARRVPPPSNTPGNPPPWSHSPPPSRTRRRDQAGSGTGEINWEDDVHPALVGRPQEPIAPQWTTPPAEPGAQELISGSWPREPQLGAMTTTGSFGAVVGKDYSGAIHARRRSHQADAEDRPRTRRLLVVLGLLVCLAIAGMAVYRGFVLANSRSAVNASSAEAGVFDLNKLEALDVELANAASADPHSTIVAARLAWTRNLRARLAGTSPVEAPKIEPGNTEAAAWALGAQVLGALSNGQPNDAAMALPDFLVTAGSANLPPGLSAWLQGEVALARGNRTTASTAYQESAAASFLPAYVGLVDTCLRYGDAPCARKAMVRLEKAAPGHPAIGVGAAAIAAMETVLRSPMDETLPKVPDHEGAARDRRFGRWLAVASSASAPEVRPADLVGFPLLRVTEARRLLRGGQPGEAAAVLEGFRRDAVTPSLRTAYGIIAARGFASAGRPDLALKHVAAPADGRTAAQFAADHPHEALTRADLLGDVGKLSDARALLAALLDRVLIGPRARLIAMRLHLHEGRMEDLARHVDRLGSHRGSLVGNALIDAYQGRPGSAAARLGPSTPDSLPDPDVHPQLHRLEVRTRLLILVANDRRTEAIHLLDSTTVPPALRARILGATRGAEDLARAIASQPTRLDDRADIAAVAFEGGDMATAETWAGSVVEACPTHTEGHLVLAKVYLARGDGERAARHLRSAARDREGHPELAVLRAESLIVSGETILALPILKKHLDIYPSDQRAMALLGRSYLKARRFTFGRADLEERLKRINPKRDGPTAGEAHLWIAMLSGATKGHQRGGAHLRHARRLLDDRPDVLLAMGQYNQERGDGGHAIELYKLASDARTGSAKAHLALGRLALVRKQRGLAKLALERYLRDAPEGDSAGWARRQVEHLEGHRGAR